MHVSIHMYAHAFTCIHVYMGACMYVFICTHAALGYLFWKRPASQYNIQSINQYQDAQPDLVKKCPRIALLEASGQISGEISWGNVRIFSHHHIFLYLGLQSHPLWSSLQPLLYLLCTSSLERTPRKERPLSISHILRLHSPLLHSAHDWRPNSPSYPIPNLPDTFAITTDCNRRPTLSPRLDHHGFWAGTETKVEVWLLRTIWYSAGE